MLQPRSTLNWDIYIFTTTTSQKPGYVSSYNVLALGRMWGRHGGLRVSVLDSGVSGQGFELWPGILCCVLGQDTVLSQCLFPSRFINGYWQI